MGGEGLEPPILSGVTLPLLTMGGEGLEVVLHNPTLQSQQDLKKSLPMGILKS